MKPAIVLPFHDPTGVYFSQLEAVTPQLKYVFSRAFVSISPVTLQMHSQRISALGEDPFFSFNFSDPDSLVGDHYRSAYRSAVDSCAPDLALHLCDIDKVAFVLQSEYRDLFLADIQKASNENSPVLFQRTPAAWASYPKNYREIEHLAIQVAEFLFGKYIDIAWSHLVIRAGHLNTILPQLKSRDFGILAEILLLLKDVIGTKDVDWLLWEDPFIYSRNPDDLKTERDNSIEETQKRLQWLRPIMRVLLDSV